jgi:hypothetical protein
VDFAGPVEPLPREVGAQRRNAALQRGKQMRRGLRGACRTQTSSQRRSGIRVTMWLNLLPPTSDARVASTAPGVRSLVVLVGSDNSPLRRRSLHGQAALCLRVRSAAAARRSDSVPGTADDARVRPAAGAMSTRVRASTGVTSACHGHRAVGGGVLGHELFGCTTRTPCPARR